VQLLLDGFGGDARKGPPQGKSEIACYHVNCRVSDGMDDIGSVRFGKFLALVGYCLEAIWCRFRYGISTLYYVPAPGKRSALYRDWVVMLLCRPFFKHLILHWHAVGLGEWLECYGTRAERWITQRLLGRPDLSIALACASSNDAAWLLSRKTVIVPNGLPDPCPEFSTEILPLKKSRIEQRKRRREPESGEISPSYRALFLGHCIREKGLFDSLEGVALFNQRHPDFPIHLTVAGLFMDEAEKHEFTERIARPDLSGFVTYAGFVSGAAKNDLLRESDCLCFPTYYRAESFGLTIVEAMAFGIPSIVTRWRAIPEILPQDYSGYVAQQSPTEIADALEQMAGADLAETLRAHYLEHFSAQSWMRQLAASIKMPKLAAV